MKESKMKTHTREVEDTEHTTHATGSMLTGFLVGGVIGAATALLLAPRSGDETRAQIRDKAVELRDRTTETVKDTVSQAKSRANEIKDNVSEKAEELKQRGKHAVSQQLDRVAQAAEDGKKKVEEY
jgi:gas vesicle protein